MALGVDRIDQRLRAVTIISIGDGRAGAFLGGGDGLTDLGEDLPPGRAELDDSQEINYAAVMKAILQTGYKGYVGQEFIPTRNKVASLNEAVKLCDV